MYFKNDTKQKVSLIKGVRLILHSFMNFFWGVFLTFLGRIFDNEKVTLKSKNWQFSTLISNC
jgi:hypothetical protein